MICIGNSIGSHQMNIDLDRNNNYQLRMSIDLLSFFLSRSTFASKDRDSVRNRRNLIFDDNSMKDGGYNLHFPCLICTFMRLTYRRLVVLITLHVIDGLQQKDMPVQHIK
jgi:hypothetical protein